MMRSMYSGVAGLKTHQTRMDVIGNNIANVNTAGFKSSQVTFSDVLYQTTQSASGPNADTGAAGKNAMQIGLGSKVSGISANMAVAGGTQTTDNPFDVMINGDGFFIVNQGGTNYFTKAGAFKIDANGTLCTSSGATVMGWQPNEDGSEIVKDTVSPLRVMDPAKMTAEPEATKKATASGNIDTQDKQTVDGGLPVSFSIFDKKGNKYSVKMLMKKTGTGEYSVSLGDITDENGLSIFVKKNADGKYIKSGASISFAGATYVGPDDDDIDSDKGTLKAPLSVSGNLAALTFDKTNGKFDGIGGTGVKTIELVFGGSDIVPDSFEKVEIDFSSMTNYSAGGTSTAAANRGDKNGKDAGLQVGEMQSISIDGAGKIIGSYTNGTSKYLGQLALAEFSNPSGLEAIGGNLFAETKNSGEFDGIGIDPSTGDSSLTTGALEMSNVDLSAQFTDMIVTQRGFQANSRIITTSDTMLEELINLKR